MDSGGPGVIQAADPCVEGKADGGTRCGGGGTRCDGGGTS
jgi:hypothetical protein